ncbi:phosphopantetheine-binding protein [Anatilimnocola sp. NA78]|uniref:phosphopantetheine-binding protein n=1 Tax=Anatilimnocola sp. NA78 TaxID=3415683 RepID=UPI003CE48EC3
MISSRTPEGAPHHCPVCNQAVIIEPSLPFGDAPCPHCGHLLWFVAVQQMPMVVTSAANHDLQDRVLKHLANQLGVPVEMLRAKPQLLETLGVDSLDTVELVMELEELQ